MNPGVPLPPFITLLTGITEAMVAPAPEIEELLPTLLEFLHGAVIVGHNIRFDCAFLDAALRRNGYRRLGNRRVDTIGLARRLVREDVPNLRLHTLATHFRTDTEPVHRAYADAAATGEVFHSLLEHAGTFGVFGLDDLIALPKVRVHRSTAKLALTGALPRAPGVYVFHDRAGEVIYVGKATNLRAQVRAYFAGDERPTVPQLLREATRIEHRVCAGPLETAVRARPARPGPATALQPLVPRAVAAVLPPADRHPSGPTHARAHGRTGRRARPRTVPLRRGGRGSCSARSHRRPIPKRCSTHSPHGCATSPGPVARAPSTARARTPCACSRRSGRGGTRGCSSSTRRKAASRCGPDGRTSRATAIDRDSGTDGDTPADVDELLLVARWITRNARRVRLVYAEGVWASELPVAPVAVGERPELVTV